MSRTTSARRPLGRVRLFVPAAFAWLAICAAPAHTQGAASDSFTTAARKLVASPPPRGRPERSIERRALATLYPATGAHPFWTADGEPTYQALEVIAALAGAGDEGLVPADYTPDSLSALAYSLTDTTAPDAAARARFDVLVSRSLARFLADIRTGRVSPDSLGFRLASAHAGFDLAGLVAQVSRSTDVAATITAAEPQFDEYRALVRTLARYRVLAADPTLRPLRRTAKPIRPGDTYDDAPALRHLLMTLGDLAPSVDTSSTVYDSALVAAIKSFQLRHELEPDGVIGPATMTQLRMPLTARVRQIELSLERLRWLPDRLPPRLVVVNVPAFQLYAFENDSTLQHPVLSMKVIVGRARGRHGTPLLAATLRQVLFRPYWDVPLRIARNELVPLLRRDPDYARRDSFEIVERDGARRYPITAQTLDRVAAGTLRLRQRPGPDNALGLIKFVFPNPYTVYLHGTPARELFSRTRRDFSHGCIRAEDPVALAKLVLEGQDAWDYEAIETAMHDVRTLTVDVARPFAVYVLYQTAYVTAGDTTLFYSDLYGNDTVLARALRLPPAGSDRTLGSLDAPARLAAFHRPSPGASPTDRPDRSYDVAPVTSACRTSSAVLAHDPGSFRRNSP